MRRALTPQQEARGRQLARILKEARRDADLPLGPFAASAGVAVDTVKSIESGRTLAPTFWVIADMARALKLDLATIADEARTETEQ